MIGQRSCDKVGGKSTQDKGKRDDDETMLGHGYIIAFCERL